LSALNIAAVTLGDIPDENRNLIQAAVARVREIADLLLQHYRSQNKVAVLTNRVEPTRRPVYRTIEAIIREKQLEYSNRKDIRLQFEGKYYSEIDLPLEHSVLTRILSNLINNSIEAMQEGGTVKVKLSQQNQLTEITVTDNGTGIPAEILPFIGALRVTHGKQNGNGVGLHFAKTLIEAVGGEMKISSTYGKGTDVVLRLPTAAKDF
jgi:signal transduction histidine kinase